MQVDFDSIQPETIEHFKGGEGSVTTQAYVDGNLSLIHISEPTRP